MEYLNTAASTAFVNEVQLPDSAMNLARAGLYFAKSIYPSIDCGWYVGQLDIIAEAVSKRIEPGASFLEQLAALNNYLFTELGYAGNVDSYYDPKNSFLNEVIDRRVGIPISLSVVFLEIAERLDIKARGVAFPGHFLVSVFDHTQQYIVDPFDGGISLKKDTFVSRLQSKAEQKPSADAIDQALKPAIKIEILLRQLRNLLQVYSSTGDVEKTLVVVNHMLAINPEMQSELLRRASLLAALGNANAAIADYETVLELNDDMNLQQEIRDRLRELQAKSEHLH